MKAIVKRIEPTGGVYCVGLRGVQGYLYGGNGCLAVGDVIEVIRQVNNPYLVFVSK